MYHFIGYHECPVCEKSTAHYATAPHRLRRYVTSIVAYVVRLIHKRDEIWESIVSAWRNS